MFLTILIRRVFQLSHQIEEMEKMGGYSPGAGRWSCPSPGRNETVALGSGGPGVPRRAGTMSRILCLVLASVSKKGQGGWRGYGNSDGKGPGDGAAAGTPRGHHSHTSPCLVVVALGGGGETPGNGVESLTACGSRRRAAGLDARGCQRGWPGTSPLSPAPWLWAQGQRAASAACGFVLCMPRAVLSIGGRSCSVCWWERSSQLLAERPGLLLRLDSNSGQDGVDTGSLPWAHASPGVVQISCLHP